MTRTITLLISTATLLLLLAFGVSQSTALSASETAALASLFQEWKDVLSVQPNLPHEGLPWSNDPNKACGETIHSNQSQRWFGLGCAPSHDGEWTVTSLYDTFATECIVKKP
jgi:hypothetical protein